MHNETCEAPICLGDKPRYEKKVIWYPGEPVCGKSPMTKFQRMQRRINRKVERGTFKHTGRYFTADMLGKLSMIRDGTKGRDPEAAR